MAAPAISIGVKLADLQKLFVDRAPIDRAIERANKRNTIRGAALVRKVARRSIRRTKKKTSRPGEPPKSHVSRGIKEIFFAYDPARESAVVGPISFGGGDNTPAVLEFGGRATITRRKRDGTTEVKRVRQAARPFMAPALEKSQATYAGLWADTVQ